MRWPLAVYVLGIALIVGACSDDDGRTGAGGSSEAEGDAPGLELEGVDDGVAASGDGALMSEAKVDVSVEAVGDAASPMLQVGLVIDQGWHVNANPASLDFLIPTEVTVRADGQALDVAPRYPEAEALDAGLSEGPIAVYTATPMIEVELPEEVTGDEVTLEIRVQACNDTGRCLAPSTIERQVTPAPTARQDRGDRVFA